MRESSLQKNIKMGLSHVSRFDLQDARSSQSCDGDGGGCGGLGDRWRSRQPELCGLIPAAHVRIRAVIAAGRPRRADKMPGDGYAPRYRPGQ